MIKFILTLLIFALPLAIDPRCYYTGQIKTSILLIGSIWLGYFLWIAPKKVDYPWLMGRDVKLPDISILLFFGWVVLSYFVSPFKFGDPLEALITYACYLVVYLSAREYFTTDMLKTCLELVIYILFGMFLYAFWGRYSAILDNLTTLKNYGAYEFRGSFGQAGIFGSWLALVIPFLLYRKRWIACFLGLILLWLTGSRSGIIGAIMGVSVVCYAISSRVWQKIAVVCIGLLLLSGIFYKYANYFNNFAPQTERISFWGSAVQMTIDKPVMGHGVGSFRVNYPLYRNPIITEKVYATPNLDLMSAHSWPLQMGAELGLIGLGLFLFLIWKHFKMGQEWGLVAGTFAVLIANISDVAFYYTPISFMLFLYLGLLSQTKEAKVEENIANNWNR